MHTGRMSRMRTSFASLLWARPATRRACSREVRAGSGPFFAASLAAVEAELGDPRGHRRRDEIVDRLAARDPVADVAGGDRHRLELEEAHAVGAFQPRQYAAEPLTGVTGTRADGDLRQLEHPVWILPLQEPAELVGAEQEERVVPAALAQHVDGALVPVELDALVPRSLGDEHDEVVETELLLRCPSKRDVAVVRRVEGPAQQARGHASSTTSSPRSISSPGFAPACLSASSSSSSPGSSPTTRKPRSVR